MRAAFAWTRSTVGMKAQMAASGALLFGFVVAHMAGNLKAFQGAQKFNEYGEFIRDFGAPVLPPTGFLWIQRIGLLGVLVLHGALAYRLARLSRQARPKQYKQRPDLGFSYASRTMRWGGVIVGMFIVYHLLHFTVGSVHPDFIGTDPYHNLVVGLSNPIVALSYCVAITALAFHLYHGLWSATQTLGVAQGHMSSFRRPLVAALTGLVWFGFLVVPAAIQLGIIR